MRHEWTARSRADNEEPAQWAATSEGLWMNGELVGFPEVGREVLALAGGGARPCLWSRYGGDGYWNSGRGEAYYFDEGAPRDGGFDFCPYCGNQIEVIAEEVG